MFTMSIYSLKLSILYVTSYELFIYYDIDELVALEAPIHKR